MTYGIFEYIQFKEYRALPHMNKSSLDKINKSPSHYQYFLTNHEEETEAMKFGSAFHDYLLLPATFKENYAVGDKWDLRTKIGKEGKSAFESANIGKMVVSQQDLIKFEGMKWSIMQDPIGSNLLTAGKPEVTCLWHDDLYDLDCKARADLYIPENKMLVDIKTTTDGSFNAFQRSISNFRYHSQAGFYIDGFSKFSPIEYFTFIVVEKSAPYATAIYCLDAESIERGKESIRKNIETYKECQKTNSWPGYTKEPMTINIPAYSW